MSFRYSILRVSFININLTMKTRIFIFSLFFTLQFTFAQKGEAVLILKDSSQIQGSGDISGILSIPVIKFKNDSLKYKKYGPDEIIGMDILENNYFRKFRFKYIKKDKFPSIMEIVSIDSLSLYVQIFDGERLSRSMSTLPMVMVNQGQTLPFTTSKGETISIYSASNFYMQLNVTRFSYFVGEGESEKVEPLYTRGLPFSKSFKKSMKKYFKDCPSLLEKVEKEEFTKHTLKEVLLFYNRNCFQNYNN